MGQQRVATPTYQDLLQRQDAPPGSSWGLFGEHDQLGMIGLLTSDRVVAAASLVRKGSVFNLDYAINGFNPHPGRRQLAKHTIYQNHPDHRDDYIDHLYLQSTSQIDGLRHRRHHTHGFYNATPDERIQEGSPDLGINRWAEHGIVGRGVLLDVKGYLSRRGRHLDHRRGEAFSVDLLEQVAAAQNVGFKPADILLVRTGWSEFYINELSDSERQAFSEKTRAAGLVQSENTLAWLWDHQFALVAADNIAVEATPAVASSPYGPGPEKGRMHQELLALLGMPLGERWQLKTLADDCERDGVYECLVIAKPLFVVGGVGSPANALAIK